MKSIKTILRDFFIGTPAPKEPAPVNVELRRPKVEVPGEDRPVALPSGRSSIPHQPLGPGVILASLGSQFRVVNHPFIVQCIPVIRRLMMINPDISQAIHNIVTLGNTGHKVVFDKTVPLDQVIAMRQHLEDKKLDWAAGCAGMDGLVNKMFAQCLVGGAISNEWVVNKKLDGIDTVILVNPEDIVFTLEEGNVKYKPWQRIIGLAGYQTAYNAPQTPTGLIPLNPYTYRYYALNGDTEVPYGFPPYLAALDRILAQIRMHTNIDYMTNQWGLLGFLSALIQRPEKIDGENDKAYENRLTALLTTAQERLMTGVKNGLVVGFKDDHEFEFNSFTQGVKDAIDIFKNNELMIGSGIKQDMTLLGRDYNTSETQITVVFTKLISELKNTQNMIRANLEFGYKLELTLAGFNFKYLKVVFNQSTLQDFLKFQQAEEIKIRNVLMKRLMGLISQDTAADELGYEEPDQEDALVDWEILAGGSTPTDEAGQEDTKQKKKDASDKKVRKKNKPMPKD